MVGGVELWIHSKLLTKAFRASNYGNGFIREGNGDRFRAFGLSSHGSGGDGWMKLRTIENEIQNVFQVRVLGRSFELSNE